jgi:hypothetical protein
MYGHVPCPLCRAVQHPSDTDESTELGTCPVCLDETKCGVKLFCGHYMCAACWERWTDASDGSFMDEFLELAHKKNNLLPIFLMKSDRSV